jgi:solute carrier family 25 protein 39/40
MQSIPRQCQVLYQGTLDAARKIVRREGFSTLWRGTGPALVMAVPQVGIYLPTYEWLKKTLEQSQTLSDGNNDGGSILPVFLAGTTARALAVLITSPLERARTRAQAFTASASASATNKVNGGRKGKGGLRCLSHEVFGVAAKGGSAGIGNLWKGTVATLARDIPFSGIYWVTLETIRNRINRNTKQPGEGGGEVKNIIMNNNSSFGGGDHPSAGHGSSSATTNNTLRDVALVNLVAGTSAGVVAASLTTPLDVVKTRVQVDLDNANAKGKNNNNAVRGLRQIAQMLREIVSQEGAKNLFAGAGARAARAAPSCAIVLTSYEVLKTVLNKNF